jgi:hypothetical protein
MKGIGTVATEPAVAGMIDGGRNKVGIRKRLRDIVMADTGTAPAVRHDDKRELVAADRTIFIPGTVMFVR